MKSTHRTAPAAPVPLKDIIATQRPKLIQAIWLSVVIGSLSLVSSWFMFEVYGRVLNSRNMNTLFWLVLMVLGVYVVMELLELVRGRALHHAGEQIDEQLRARLFDATFEANLRKAQGGSPQTFNDLKTLRDFISTPAVTAVMDTPTALICMLILFAMSPWLGVLALVGAALQVALAFMTEKRTMPLLSESMVAAIQAQNYAASTLRNAQVIESMGMMGNIHRRWMRMQRRFLAKQAEASDYGGINATLAKLLQTMQSSLLLGGACYLVLHNGLWGGGGMMIVASILGGKVLQPLAQLVGQWRSVVGVRDAYTRLDSILKKFVPAVPGMPLPAPKGALSVEGLVAAAPGSNTTILRGVNFALKPGESVAVIGPSASGKSTLARMLMGIWPAASGKVRLDGADVYAWNKAELGPHVGYLPQTVELFDGTMAENIARFGNVDMALVREAAQLVGMTEMIEALPKGFDTRIGDDGAVLSGGQRQRLGLARAVYGKPSFLVLDEPNSSLDEAGEKSLLQMLLALKAAGTTVVVITHRTTLLPAADKLLILNDGQVAAFGARDEVLAALKKANEQARAAMEAQRNPTAARPTPLPGAAA